MNEESGSMQVVSRPVYEEQTNASRARRMAWWHDARFGMFVHYGLHSVLARNEWVMATECWPVQQYEKLAAKLTPRRGCAREWVRLAKEAGMRYAVLTTRHHEGFSLWDSKVNPYNVVRCCPGGFDIVREFVEACRDEGLRIGLYFSLMDWHHPDGGTAAYDVPARLRFHEFLRGMLQELLGGAYGKIDVLWYDVPRPMESHEGWDALTMNQLVRQMQPDIAINNRSHLPEDFSTPEEHLTAADGDRQWEACMTFNRISWGYLDSEQVGPYSYNAQGILRMLQTVCAKSGNLLLNIGPTPDGSVPAEAVESLRTVGRWLSQHGTAVYGALDCNPPVGANGICSFSQRGNKVYAWQWIWSDQLIFGGFVTKLKAIRTVPGGELVPFEQTPSQILVAPRASNARDAIANVSVLELEFEAPPVHRRRMTYPQLHQGRDWMAEGNVPQG
jgi:alpha-L-fucosidase